MTASAGPILSPCAPTERGTMALTTPNDVTTIPPGTSAEACCLDHHALGDRATGSNLSQDAASTVV
jgi:hypothetical protein